MHRERLEPRSAPTLVPPANVAAPAAHAGAGDVARRNPVRRFLVWLAVLVAAFYALASTSAFRSHVATPLMGLDARVAAAVLSRLGHEVRAHDRVVAAGSDFALEVRRGCDALEPTVLFALAVLVAPAAATAKALGLVLGVVLLVGLNTVRIVSLFFVGRHRPDLLEIVHTEWQVAFVLVAIAAWVAWAAWSRDRGGDAGASAA
jgi:exosortase H (IPTLxxWG-CTERM-specific)